MTQNPWNTVEPFEDMFTDTISLSGVRENGTYSLSTVQACAFPIEDVDPFSDVDAETEVKAVSILVLKKSLSVKPQIGDEVVVDDEHYKICKVSNSLGWFDMKARMT